MYRKLDDHVLMKNQILESYPSCPVGKFKSSLLRYDLLFYPYLILGDWYKAARTVALESSNFGKGDVVLDLGCGTSRNLTHISEAVGDTGTFVGVDYSERMARYSARRATTCRVEIHNLDASSFLAGSLSVYDAIVCTLSLSVMEDWEKVCHSAFDALKPGGTFTVMDIEPNVVNPLRHIVRFFAGEKGHHNTAEIIARRSSIVETYSRQSLVGEVKITVGTK